MARAIVVFPETEAIRTINRTAVPYRRRGGLSIFSIAYRLSPLTACTCAADQLHPFAGALFDRRGESGLAMMTLVGLIPFRRRSIFVPGSCYLPCLTADPKWPPPKWPPRPPPPTNRPPTGAGES
jgi:hypothetical protein